MNDSLEQIIRKKAQIFSSVTGLPIKHEKFVNLQADIFPDELGNQIVPMSYTLILGDSIEEYSLLCSIHYRYEREYFIPSVEWGVAYNGKSISSSAYTIVGGSTPDNILETEKTQEDGIRLMNQCIGGISIDHGAVFMDYENFTLEGINGKDSYFRNMYLALMTHLKKRNIALPPILCKDDSLRKFMENGDIKEVESALEKIFTQSFDAQNERFLRHMEAEAEKIRAYTQKKNNYMDPFVPLREKIRTEEIIVPGYSLPTYSILVVENEILNYKIFSQRVSDILESHEEFGGSSLFVECNLPCCIKACQTGQVDFILFNWMNPSHEEAMMFECIQDEKEKTQTYNINMGEICTSEERYNAWEQALKIKSERVGIRKKWMQMIEQGCEEKNVPVPPYYIIETEQELNSVHEIIGSFVGDMKKRHLNTFSDNVH